MPLHAEDETSSLPAQGLDHVILGTGLYHDVAAQAPDALMVDGNHAAAGRSGIPAREQTAFGEAYAVDVAVEVAVLVGDQPRQLKLGPQDEICLQLQRADNGQGLSARVRVLRPEPQELVVVNLAGPGISPGTYRSTPSGMLLRAALVKPDDAKAAVGTDGAPVCVL